MKFVQIKISVSEQDKCQNVNSTVVPVWLLWTQAVYYFKPLKFFFVPIIPFVFSIKPQIKHIHFQICAVIVETIIEVNPFRWHFNHNQCPVRTTDVNWEKQVLEWKDICFSDPTLHVFITEYSMSISQLPIEVSIREIAPFRYWGVHKCIVFFDQLKIEVYNFVIQPRIFFQKM